MNKLGEPFLACCPDSNYKEVTAVEWLIDEIEKGLFEVDHVPIDKDGKSTFALSIKVSESTKKQAQQMHRKQIIDAVGVGSQFDRNYLYGYHDKAEQYYTKTYGQ